MKNSLVHEYQLDDSMKRQALQLLPKLRNRRVLVVGDVGLDEYVMGSVRRISPEAPVPVVEVESEDLRLGLSAFVAQNVLSLGGQVRLMGVVGADRGASLLQDLFKKTGVPWDDLVVDESRPTTRKSRIMAKNHHVVRVDYEHKRSIHPDVEKRLIQKIREAVVDVDVVVLEDYAKGVVTKTLVQEVSAICKAEGKLLLADPHRSQPAEMYRGVTWLKPNFDEAIDLAKVPFEEIRANPDLVFQLGPILKEKTLAEVVVLTQGAQGILIFAKNGKVMRIPTFAQEVYDVTGAGDTVVATMALAAAAKLELADCAILANCAAGIVVTKVGCVPCEFEELRESLVTAE